MFKSISVWHEKNPTLHPTFAGEPKTFTDEAKAKEYLQKLHDRGNGYQPSKVQFTFEDGSTYLIFRNLHPKVTVDFRAWIIEKASLFLSSPIRHLKEQATTFLNERFPDVLNTTK